VDWKMYLCCNKSEPLCSATGLCIDL